jgi:hypothetical protein
VSNNLEVCRYQNSYLPPRIHIYLNTVVGNSASCSVTSNGMSRGRDPASPIRVITHFKRPTDKPAWNICRTGVGIHRCCVRSGVSVLYRSCCPFYFPCLFNIRKTQWPQADSRHMRNQRTTVLTKPGRFSFSFFLKYLSLCTFVN